MEIRGLKQPDTAKGFRALMSVLAMVLMSSCGGGVRVSDSDSSRVQKTETGGPLVDEYGCVAKVLVLNVINPEAVIPGVVVSANQEASHEDYEGPAVVAKVLPDQDGLANTVTVEALVPYNRDPRSFNPEATSMCGVLLVSAGKVVNN